MCRGWYGRPSAAVALCQSPAVGGAAPYGAGSAAGLTKPGWRALLQVELVQHVRVEHALLRHPLAARSARVEDEVARLAGRRVGLPREDALHHHHRLQHCGGTVQARLL